MKIAIITMHASPLAKVGSIDCGGQNVYVNNIARELLKKGIKIDIFTRKDKPGQPHIVTLCKDMRVIHIEAGPLKFIPKENILAYVNEFSLKIIEFINKNGRYDLIHANFFDSGYAACKIKQYLKIPFIITFHALGIIRKQFQKKNDHFPKERIQIEKNIMDFADGIIAECPQDKDDMISNYYVNSKKLKIIPCGFDCHDLTPIEKDKSRDKIGIPYHVPLILNLGRLVPRKGIENIIKALGVLIKRKPEKTPHLLILGGESQIRNDEKNFEVKRLRDVAKNLNVLDHITFFGRVDHHILKFFYSAADFFVTTPWYEPFGITTVEAMACRIPVIGSNVGGLKYTIINNQTGFLVQPENSDELANKIDVLINDLYLRKYFGENGYKRAHNMFTWKIVTEKMFEFYYSILEKGQESSVNSLEFACNPNSIDSSGVIVYD